MFITKQVHEHLIKVQEAAAAIIAHHPGEYIPYDEYSSDSGFTQCFYCLAVEHDTPEMELKGVEMQRWLEANPSPNLYQQKIKRKEAPDMQTWDRENSRRHNSYHQLMGAWRRKYGEKYAEVWGDPNQHPGTIIEHKEDCIWRLLKEALDASD